MKSNVAVTEYMWGSDDDENFCTLDFAVYKKGLLGGMKPDRRFDGWCLCFQLTNNGKEIDIEYLHLSDGNFRGQPLIPGLVHAVLIAGSITLSDSGEKQKAKMLNQTAIDFFKKFILK